MKPLPYRFHQAEAFEGEDSAVSANSRNSARRSNTLAGIARAALAGTALLGTIGFAGAQTTAGMVDDKRMLAANDQTDENNWINFGQDYRNQRFSALTQINRDNVGKLQVAWVYQMGSLGSTQVEPSVVDGVMYFTSANNDVIAANAATGEEIWRYRHKFRAG